MLLQNSTAQRALYPEGTRNISQDIESQRLQIKALKTTKQDKTKTRIQKLALPNFTLLSIKIFSHQNFNLILGREAEKYKNAV